VTDRRGKERSQDHMILFKFWSPSHISGVTEARVVKFCIHVDRIVISLGMANCPVPPKLRVGLLSSGRRQKISTRRMNLRKVCQFRSTTVDAACDKLDFRRSN